MKRKILFVALMLFATLCFAESLSQLRIVADDGTFLGTFESEYSSNSIYNRYGTYGSKYNSSSIFNKYGTYGSDYSQYSPFNQYSYNAPWLMDGYGNIYGRLSVNRYASGVTRTTYNLALQLKSMRDSM